MVRVFCVLCGAGGAGETPPYNCHQCEGKQTMHPCSVPVLAQMAERVSVLTAEIRALKAQLAAAEPVAGEWSVKQANLSSPTMQKGHPDRYSYKPVRLMPADLKIGENDSALPLANLIAAALNAYTAPPQHAARVPKDVLSALKRAAHEMAESPAQTQSFITARVRVVAAIKKYDPSHYGLAAPTPPAQPL